jgi:hypothetical protein
MGGSLRGLALAKIEPVRSPAYRKEVAAMRCFRCKLAGFTQACHGDADKGMSLKTCDLTCWPGCGPRVGNPGCHEFVGRMMTREQRREFEALAAAATQAELILKSSEPGEHKLRATLRAVGLVR